MENLIYLTELLSSLFITYDKRFIEQLPTGRYKTYNNQGLYLGESFLSEHLLGNRTFGILEHKSAKFMTFDVDESNKPMVQEIIDLHRMYGFHSDAIHVNISGSKGYHIHVFFDRPVLLEQIELLQGCILRDLYDRHPEYERVHVDLRPAPGKGIKLPLGVHRVTMNRCWFCDRETLEPVKSFDYLYSIRQLPRAKFDVILNELFIRNNKDRIMQRGYALIHSSKHIPSTTVSRPLSPIELLTAEKILQKGTRHRTLLRLCSTLRFSGMERNECTELLIAWMHHQNPENYTTPMAECIKDIRYIVDYMYADSDSFSSSEYSSFSVLHRSDLLFVLKFKSPSAKRLTLSSQVVLLYFIINHKDYNGYSTRWLSHATSTLEKALNLSQHTIQHHIQTLINAGYIEIQSGTCTQANYMNCLYGNPANEYRITQKLIDELAEFEAADTCDKTFMVQRSNSIDTILRDAANALFTRKELREMLTKAQYANLCLMKEVA